MTFQSVKKIPLFTKLPDNEIQALVAHSQVCHFQAGEILINEGAKTDYFYALLNGKVEIIKSLGTPDERWLRTIHNQTLLGEMSRFIQEDTHTASVRTLTPCTCLRVTFDWFDGMLSRYPKMAFDFISLYSKRLAHSESITIRDLREKNCQLTQAYHDLKIAQAAMIEKERLEQEMRLAGKIQRRIQPKELPTIPSLDVGALMIPAKQVGGDFYDFLSLDNHRVGIVIGDVCDKGMPAALLMALTYSSVRMASLRGADPGDTLRTVNQHLLQIDCSEMFVTLIYGILNCKTRQFSYARAGHPKPLLLDGHQKPLNVPCRLGQAVGIFDNFTIDEETIEIPVGGTLLVYSDGLSETLEDQAHTPELEDLCTSLLKKTGLDAQCFCEKLWQAVNGSSEEPMIKDDFTLVVLRSTDRSK